MVRGSYRVARVVYGAAAAFAFFVAVHTLVLSFVLKGGDVRMGPEVGIPFAWVFTAIGYVLWRRRRFYLGHEQKAKKKMTLEDLENL